MSQDPSDGELVAMAVAGDEVAFERLYLRHAPALSRHLRRVLNDGADIEDVLQATFLQVHRSLARQDPERSFKGWLYRVAFHVTGTHLRSKRRKNWMTPASDREQSWTNGGREEEDAAKRQLAGLLAAELDKLGPDKRIAFALHELEGLGPTEIGEIVGASPQTVWARVESARKELRKHLRRALGTQELMEVEHE